MTRETLIKDALHRIADRAEPIEGMAEYAIRRAAWRRRGTLTAVVAGAAGVVAAVTVPITVLGGGTDGGAASPPRPGHAMLPSNTPAQIALARSCFAGGDPRIPDTDKPRRGKPDVAAPGEPGRRVRDFRVLVSFRDANGQAVLLGSSLAHRICSIRPSGRPHPEERNPGVTANRWRPPLATFRAPVTVDATMGNAVDDRRVSATVVAGRTAEEVARLTFTMPGGRTTDAALANGFFVWRVTRPLDEADPTMNPATWATARAYDRHGRLLKSFKQIL